MTDEAERLKSAQFKTINPRRCPHHILVGSHYRDDGSCRCNDITATEMTKWGYTWSATAQLWEAGPEEDEHEWSAQSEKPLDTPSLDTSFHDHEMDTDGDE